MWRLVIIFRGKFLFFITELAGYILFNKTANPREELYSYPGAM